jgi:hypothetical protein
MLASGAFFARKFDPGVDDEVFDRLDERLGLRSALHGAVNPVGAS